LAKKKAKKKTKKKAKKVSKQAKKTKRAPSKGLTVSSPEDFITPDSMKKALGLVEIMKYGYSLDNCKKVKFKAEYVKSSKIHMINGFTMHDYARKIGIHYNTLMVWTSRHCDLKDAIIEGLYLFIKSLPPKLIEHMGQGHSFESFGAVCGRSRSWLYDLVRIDEDFREAKEKGYTGSLLNWEKLQHAQAAGRLVRVGREIVRTNDAGDPLINPSTGDVLTDKTYVPAMGSDRALVFAMQCRFEECREEKKDSQQDLHNEIKDAMEARERRELEKINQGEK